MTQTKTIVINFAINSLIFYVIGRTIRGHQTGLRLGLVGGIVSGLVTWHIDTQSEETHD